MFVRAKRGPLVATKRGLPTGSPGVGRLPHWHDVLIADYRIQQRAVAAYMMKRERSSLCEDAWREASRFSRIGSQANA